MADRVREGAGRTAARHPHPAGAVPARRGGEVRGPLEGRRGRLVRARRPRRDRAAAGRAGRLLRRAGAELLPDSAPSGAAEPPPRLILDLEQLQDVPAEQAGPLARYAATIQSQRGDYNGRVLSIRQDDLRTLAVIYDESPEPAHRAADHLGRAQRRRPGARLRLVERLDGAVDSAGPAAAGQHRLEVQQPAEQAVDERRRVVGRQRRGQLDRLVDRPRRPGTSSRQSSS